jgi:hypothetical protein
MGAGCIPLGELNEQDRQPLKVRPSLEVNP